MKSPEQIFLFAKQTKVNATEHKENSICGIPFIVKGFVVRGNDFDRGSFPWMVALMYSNDDEVPRYFCGGSLISKNHVVTGEKLLKK